MICQLKFLVYLFQRPRGDIQRLCNRIIDLTPLTGGALAEALKYAGPHMNHLGLERSLAIIGYFAGLGMVWESGSPAYTGGFNPETKRVEYRDIEMPICGFGADLAAALMGAENRVYWLMRKEEFEPEVRRLEEMLK